MRIRYYVFAFSLLGCKCIEAHRQALPMYLNPPSEADEEAGAQQAQAVDAD